MNQKEYNKNKEFIINVYIYFIVYSIAALIYFMFVKQYSVKVADEGEVFQNIFPSSEPVSELFELFVQDNISISRVELINFLNDCFRRNNSITRARKINKFGNKNNLLDDGISIIITIIFLILFGLCSIGLLFLPIILCGISIKATKEEYYDTVIGISGFFLFVYIINLFREFTILGKRIIASRQKNTDKDKDKDDKPKKELKNKGMVFILIHIILLSFILQKCVENKNYLMDNGLI
jgi:hypothetical protein